MTKKSRQCELWKYRMIAEAVAAMPLGKKPTSFHWGDMDLGGIRIFQHLKEHFFPDLQPWLMDVETYRANLDKGSRFDAAYGEKLTALADKPGYQSWGPLIREMLKHGKRIEQEAVCPDIAWPG